MIADLQRMLLEALRQPDPQAWLRAQVAGPDRRLSAAERAMLAALPDDGLALTRQLIRKLRLQRLLHGDPEAVLQCNADPAALASAFAAYDAEVPPREVFPADEARAFRERGRGAL